MLRRLLRSLPRSPKIFGQRPVIASLRPSTFVYIGISAATIATVITIHADATQSSDKFGKKKGSSVKEKQAYSPVWPPSFPAADGIFDNCSQSEVFEREEVGVRRIDSIVLPSNYPCEDMISTNSVRLSNTLRHSMFSALDGDLRYSLFSVFDGHNGCKMSEALNEILPEAVFEDLLQLYSAHVADPSEKEIDQCIKEAFMRVDTWAVNNVAQEVLDKQNPKEEGVKLLSLANAGSCALVGIYNNVKRTLKVALTGDSRAVLGRRVALEEDTYAYETHALSADQNGYNPHEVERLETAHPGEEIFENGRMLDWGMSRAFGNAAYKLSLDIQERLHEEYLGDPPRSDCLTPPYFTAEPVITTTTIKKGDFVVLASDGLWDCLTNEEVVGLVGAWLETRGEEVKIGKGEGVGEGETVMVPFGKAGASGKDHRKGFGKGKGIGWPEGSNGDNMRQANETTVWEPTDLPLISSESDETQMYEDWEAAPKRFINVDGNAAVHLTRSALGGADRDLTGALLQLSPPRSRRFRDDISVLVVFFD